MVGASSCIRHERGVQGESENPCNGDHGGGGNHPSAQARLKSDRKPSVTSNHSKVVLQYLRYALVAAEKRSFSASRDGAWGLGIDDQPGHPRSAFRRLLSMARIRSKRAADRNRDRECQNDVTNSS
jgi:hypothetical protein